jgi:uncharacterized protein (TIGR02001 family)
MIKSRIAIAGALLAATTAASAAGSLTVTPTIATDYDFRGISQTARDPAFQLGVNYAHESGVYGFLWGSNLDNDSYPGADMELDVGAGFAGGDATKTFAYDVGIVYYTYPGNSDFNFPEIYGGITKDWFSAKMWYSWDFGGTGNSGFYTEANGTFPLNVWELTALAHIGYSYGNAWSGNQYFDYAVGVSRNFGNFNVSAKYIDGSDLPDAPGTNVFDTRGKFWAAVSTTLPWKKD